MDEPRHRGALPRVRARRARRTRRPGERLDDAERAVVLVVPQLHGGAARARPLQRRRRDCSPRTTCCSGTADGARAARARRVPRPRASRSTSPSPTRSTRRSAATRRRPTRSTASSTGGSSTRSSAAPTPRTSSPTSERWMPRPSTRSSTRCSRATSRSSRRHIDTLGVNYYHGESSAGASPAVAGVGGDAPTDRRAAVAVPRRTTASTGTSAVCRAPPMHWEVQPEGLTRLLQRVRDEYARAAGTSLFVTENGAAYDDVAVVEDGETRMHDGERTEFLRLHLGAILDAIDAGVDVRGYFYWSLLDNFEWAWGYEKRFGIVRVDYDTQERTSRTVRGRTAGSSPSARSGNDGRPRIPVASGRTGRVAMNASRSRDPATIEEVAAAAGVSRSTVSRVVNGSTAVSPIGAGIRPARDRRTELRAQPCGPLAREPPDPRDRPRRPGGHHAASSATPSSPRSCRASTRAPAAVGLRAEPLHRERRPRRQDGQLHATAATSTARSSSRTTRATPSWSGSRRAVPVVYGGRPVRHRESDYYVDVDNVAGGRTATEYLLERGHRRIATIAGPLTMPPGVDRLEGYREALTAAGLPDGPVEDGAFTTDGGAAAMRRILDAGDPPDAVFVASDLMARGALAALRCRRACRAGRCRGDRVRRLPGGDLGVAAAHHDASAVVPSGRGDGGHPPRAARRSPPRARDDHGGRAGRARVGVAQRGSRGAAAPPPSPPAPTW